MKANLVNNPNTAISYESSKLLRIYLAGGCFWGLEAYLSRVPGVQDAVSGYANGRTDFPTYEQVCRENTGHAETVQIAYDPLLLSLSDLLGYFFRVIDPTSLNRQGGDFGTQYRTGIYYTDEEERSVIEDFIRARQKDYDRPIVVEVEPLKHFYEAEDYHQDYLEKNPSGYCHIDVGLASEPWIDPSLYQKPETTALKTTLTELQYAVTQDSGTERPFQNLYFDHFEPGLYVDVTTGEPLFASYDKFESSCGWPSFVKPIAPDVVKEFRDTSHGMIRIEVRSRVGNAHLGHVFNDGPQERGGLRYCINSAALSFVPMNELSEKGYGHLAIWFQ